LGPTLGQLGVGAPLNLSNPLTANTGLSNPLLALNPQLLALLSNPLLSQGFTGLPTNPSAPADQSAVLSQMSQLAQLLQGGSNTGLNIGYGAPVTQSQSQQSVQVKIYFGDILHVPILDFIFQCCIFYFIYLYDNVVCISNKIRCNTLPIYSWRNKTLIRRAVEVILLIIAQLATLQGIINVEMI